MERLITAVVYITLVCITAACSTSRKSSSEVTKPYAPASKDLYDTIAYMDSVLFDAFNNRNLEKQKMIFAINLEFYHDKGGLTNYNQVIENTRRLFDQNNGLRRTLMPGSLQIYPINDYGAIEIGMHRFCHEENGKDACGNRLRFAAGSSMNTATSPSRVRFNTSNPFSLMKILLVAV